MKPSPQQRLETVCRQHNIALVYLFGSQARLGFKLLEGKVIKVIDPLADLDVGVVLAIPLPSPPQLTRLYSAIFNDLEDLFKPLPLDLSLLEENHSVFQVEALQGICVFSSSQELRDNYEMMILSRAADFRPFLAKYLQEVLEEV